jgi:hypothetical protein
MIGFAPAEQPEAGPNGNATFDVLMLTWTKQ